MEAMNQVWCKMKNFFCLINFCLLGVMLLTGCVNNNYEAFYSSNVKLLPYVNHSTVKYPFIDELFYLDEVQLWRNKGYEIIGTSSFYGLWSSRTKAIDVARKYGAEVVLVYYKLEKEKKEETTFIVPQTSSTYHNGSIYGYGNTATYSGYSTSVSYVPMTIGYTNRYFTQKAFYLSRRKTLNTYGIYFLEPDKVPGNPTKEPVIVDVVIDDSQAAKAGIKVGDVVRKINGKTITSFEEARPFMIGQIEINSVEVEHE